VTSGPPGAPDTGPADGIFISYRRSDSQMAAGRLADALVREFGDARIFRDIDDIQAGADFVDTLDRALAACQTMLVVIGPQWLDHRASDGTRRLDQPDDWVRQEVARALQRGIRVIPVLLERTPMPAADALPEALQALVRRQAVPLADAHWTRDVATLIDSLRPRGGPAVAPSGSPALSQRIGAGVKTGLTWAKRIVIGVGLLLLLLIGLLVKACFSETPDLSGSFRSDQGWQLQFAPVDAQGERRYRVSGNAVGAQRVDCDGSPGMFGSVDLICRITEGAREIDRFECSGLYVSENPLSISGDCRFANDGSTRKLKLAR
jgi:hypothetical protein